MIQRIHELQRTDSRLLKFFYSVDSRLDFSMQTDGMLLSRERICVLHDIDLKMQILDEDITLDILSTREYKDVFSDAD